MNTQTLINMPHATDNHGTPEVEDDDRAIQDMLAQAAKGEFLIPDLEKGEKADDAIDYEDISDDDLPEEEEASHLLGDEDDGAALSSLTLEQNGLDIGPADDMDDLFGDGEEDPFADLFGDIPSDGAVQDSLSLENGLGDLTTGSKPSFPPGDLDLSLDMTQPTDIVMEDTPKPAEELVDEIEDESIREQMRLFNAHRRKRIREEKLHRGEALDEDDEIPPEVETNVDLFERLWPNFSKEKTPRFIELLPIKKRTYNGKTPLRPPKTIQPHKVSLEIEQDQERQFNLNIPISRKRSHEASNQYGVSVINVQEDQQDANTLYAEPDILDDTEMIGNITVQDLRLLCETWDINEFDTIAVPEPVILPDEIDELDYESRVRAAKRIRISDRGSTLPIFSEDFESFDEPERLTAKMADRVYLDLNDPLLLLDSQPQTSVSKTARSGGMLDDLSGDIKKTFEKRYNFSNDDEYDLLKENHSNKIRSTLANVAIEHSLPAVKLQYPFYKVKLDAQESRSFHRPSFSFPTTTVKFEQLTRHKVKHMRALDAPNLYKTSDDLSMADNSQMLLVEYSEEYPIMLSNFGMGNKLINYYRRIDEEDKVRPKARLGETQVLLSQDKSPFSIFGNVEPGTTTPTFHNAMYRAPVFEHSPKSTDFLCIRSSKEGVAKWYLRNMENLFIAGQQLPSMEVPGTHSRKVTDAAKRRLRMIAYRIYKKHSDRRARDPWLSNDMIREHILGSDTAQNRSKMREFMAYDKVKSTWHPKPGDPVPDEETMRTWIKPEDICLLDSMQVGDQHLKDVGYNQDDPDVDAEEEEEKEGQGIDQKLSPWQITKNFLAACQGKAMLEIHGEGDPSGRGEAFSFIKTSMKGGFKPIGESIADKLDANRLKELGGHSYNVKQQDRAYNEAIRRIWDAQIRSLSSSIEHSDVEPDVDDEDEMDHHEIGRTPRSQVGTPSLRLGRRDDETGSQFSKYSTNSQYGKSLRIIRNIPGQKTPDVEIVTDPKIIRAYLRRRSEKELSSMTLDDLVPTGNAEEDLRKRKQLEKELLRLNRNKERRFMRMKAKGIEVPDTNPATPGTPSGANISGKPVGTTRKCANCGQVGHIKTNKKACPLLNGTIRMEQTGFNDAAFATAQTPTPGSAMSPP
jgi:transcription initiation factor TFIID subunit 1, fungi type